MNKQNLIYVLFITVVFLLLVNIGVEFSRHEKKTVKNVVVSKEDVCHAFNEVMDGYSLDKSWIEQDEKLAVISYTVRVPADIPLPLLLNSLNEALAGKNLQLKSKELKIGGDNILSVFLGKTCMLSAKFIYDKTITRKEIYIGFLLTGVQDLSEKKLAELLSVNETFSVVIVPSIEADAIPEKLKQSGKEYAVLLNDDVKDVKYKLNASYDIKRLSAIVSRVISSYPDSKAFYIDNQSDLYNSVVYNFLKEEFSKRSLTLVSLGSYAMIKSRNSEDFYSMMKYYYESTESGGKKTLVIDAADYLSFYSALKDFRKKGVKFESPFVSR